MAAIFTEEQDVVLNRTLKLRERYIEQIFSNKELPTDAKTMESIVKLLDSADGTIYNRAKLAIDKDAAENDSETKKMLSMMIVEMHNNHNNVAPSVTKDVPEFKPLGLTLVEGETISGTDVIDHTKYLDA